MAKQVNLNVTSPLEMVFRKSVPLASEETIRNGQWFELDNDGSAVLSVSDPAAIMLRYIAFNDYLSPDVSGTLPDGTSVSTGGMTGLIGTFEANVTSNAYTDNGIVAGSELTVENGKLTAADEYDVVWGIAKAAIGADGLLFFTGSSGVMLYVGAIGQQRK